MTDTTDTYRDALAAMLEALDLPHPASIGDLDQYRQVLEDRAMHVRVTLRSILRDDRHADDAAWDVSYLREQIAKTPATGYRTVDESAQQ
jgi:hypothetical protein